MRHCERFILLLVAHHLSLRFIHWEPLSIALNHIVTRRSYPNELQLWATFVLSVQQMQPLVFMDKCSSYMRSSGLTAETLFQRSVYDYYISSLAIRRILSPSVVIASISILCAWCSLNCYLHYFKRPLEATVSVTTISYALSILS